MKKNISTFASAGTMYGLRLSQQINILKSSQTIGNIVVVHCLCTIGQLDSSNKK
jgi:hypothetical protein